MADSFFNNKRDVVISAESRAPRVPTIYQWKDFVVDGGLIDYGPNIVEAYERAGELAARCCVQRHSDGCPKRACDIPIEQEANFELWINVTVATGLGYGVPANLPVEWRCCYPS